jgi:hypothetical protein
MNFRHGPLEKEVDTVRVNLEKDRHGLDRLSIDEIDAEIAAARQARRCATAIRPPLAKVP